MNAIATITVLAILTEALVEYALPFSFPPERKWLKQYIAMAVSIGICIAYQADLPAAIGLGVVPWVGYIVTGILISRGANYLSILVKRFGVVSAPSQSVDSVPQPEDRP